MSISKPEEILSFWFGDLNADAYPAPQMELWWGKSETLDTTCRERFLATWAAARDGTLEGWTDTARGRLAQIIVLDQLSRNMHRDTPDMYRLDDNAQILVLEGLLAGHDRALLPIEVTFFYMPLMHAESVALQRLCVHLFERMAREARPADLERAKMHVDYAEKHAVIVERFGRFPHRNEILGRTSTPEEIEFLKEPGSSF